MLFSLKRQQVIAEEDLQHTLDSSASIYAISVIVFFLKGKIQSRVSTGEARTLQRNMWDIRWTSCSNLLQKNIDKWKSRAIYQFTEINLFPKNQEVIESTEKCKLWTFLINMRLVDFKVKLNKSSLVSSWKHGHHNRTQHPPVLESGLSLQPSGKIQGQVLLCCYFVFIPHWSLYY